jgi:hypothetical protein
MATKKIVESNSLTLAGFGENVVQLTDKDLQEVIAYVGVLQGEEKLFLPRPVSLDQLEAVTEFFQKKKFAKHLSNENYQKAQDFADKSQ